MEPVYVDRNKKESLVISASKLSPSFEGHSEINRFNEFW